MTDPIPSEQEMNRTLNSAQAAIDQIRREYPWLKDAGYYSESRGRPERRGNGHGDPVGRVVASPRMEEDRTRIRFATEWISDAANTLEHAAATLLECLHDTGEGDEPGKPDPYHTPLTQDELDEVYHYRKLKR